MRHKISQHRLQIKALKKQKLNRLCEPALIYEPCMLLAKTRKKSTWKRAAVTKKKNALVAFQFTAKAEFGKRCARKAQVSIWVNVKTDWTPYAWSPSVLVENKLFHVDKVGTSIC